MARKKGQDINAESDRISRAGESALYKQEQTRAKLVDYIKHDKVLKERVMEFIFSKKDGTSPLEEFRRV